MYSTSVQKLDHILRLYAHRTDKYVMQAKTINI